MAPTSTAEVRTSPDPGSSDEDRQRAGKDSRTGQGSGASPTSGAERGGEDTGLNVDRQGGVLRLTATGEWVAREARHLEALTAAVEEQAQGSAQGKAPGKAPGEGDTRSIELDIAGVTRLDTLGARLLDRTRQHLAQGGATVEVKGANEAQTTLLKEVAERSPDKYKAPAATNSFIDWLADVGTTMREFVADIVGMNAFIGSLVGVTGRLITLRARLRLPAVVHQLELIAMRGVPIIVLISMITGAILSQQTIFQLRQFGATLFVADLMGILMLRELGVLLAAIMVAGRSGSAITAELGSMKMREEIDAMQVMGLDPIEVLVMPRILALVIGMPLLAFLGSMAGILGGGLTAWLYGNITPVTFLNRLRDAIALHTFLAGLIKAPVIALMLGTIACIEGLKVKGSAESLGRQTTASVVKAIFTVIVVDGIFAIFFASINF